MSSNTSVSRLEKLLPQLFEAKLSVGEPYLRFQLTETMSALISMKQVQESLVVAAEKITPLPNMPESIIGMMSSRNRVFCVVDLEQILKLPSTSISSRQYHLIVLQVSAESTQAESESDLLVAIAVRRIQGTTRLSTNQIQSSVQSFPSKLIPYLSGCVSEDNIVPVFDPQAIATRIAKLDRPSSIA